MALNQNSTTKRPRNGDDNSSDRLSVGSEEQPSTKRPPNRDGDSSDGHSVSSKKKPNLDLELLSNPDFLKLFIKFYLPGLSTKECSDRILKTYGFEYICENPSPFYIKTKRKFESDVEEDSESDVEEDSESDVEEDLFDVDMCKKLMTTYVLFYLQRDSICKVIVFFQGKILLVDFVGYSVVNGEFIFHSDLFNYRLVYDGDVICFEASTVRKDIRICIGEEAVSFKQSSDSSNPAVTLGKGAYGVVFKIFGDDKWYVVKISLDKQSAEHEWDALSRVKGKHECFQNVILLETDRGGDSPHIIVSNFQGDVVVSNIGKSDNLNFQQLLGMLFRLMEALKILHRDVGICHGDIKPDNLILSKDSNGNPIFVLIDFGIANRIGAIISDPQKCYTWCYRFPQLFLDGFLRVYNTEKWSFVEQIKASPEMDVWALIITFLQIISQKSKDFLGFHYIKEREARSNLFNASPVGMIMEHLKPYLGTNRTIKMNFVRDVYNLLVNKEGPDKFVELFRSVNIETTDAIYEGYLREFHQKLNQNPMIHRIDELFGNLYLKAKSNIDPSVPISEILNWFVQFICYGTDLSLLGCLTMEHIDQWMSLLKESHQKLCVAGVFPIFFC